MEWVETTAKTVDAAKEQALDQLGVAADEAEFDVLEEPKAGLFGRVRGEARVRARVKPTPVRPKQDRRRRGSGRKKGNGAKGGDGGAATATATRDETPGEARDEAADGADNGQAGNANRSGGNGRNRSRRSGQKQPAGQNESNQQNGATPQGDGQNESNSQQQQRKKSDMSNDTIEHDEPEVSPQEVGDAAVAFMDGLVSAFGAEGATELEIDGTELDVRVQGEGLGLLVGRGGRTLNAVQDLARVAAQRRLGDHETRLRIDVARYRERRAEALVRFAADVAEQVRSSGTARSLEPMSSADRKVIHDALNDQDGVESRSEGDDPNRRVVVSPT